MPPVTKNLGLVRAIHQGTTAPSNTKMLWFNENDDKHYAYNTGTAMWELLSSGSGAGDVFKEKVACRVATTGDEGAITYDNGAGTITNQAVGAINIDEINLSLDDRVLWLNGTIESGIYKVTTLGDGGTPWVLTRTDDSNENSDFTVSEATIITEGETSAGVWYFLISPTVDLGVTDIRYIALGSDYTRVDPVTNTIGDAEAGVYTPKGPIQGTLNKMLYTYKKPAFSSFSINTIPNSLDLGEEITAGNYTAVWGTTNSGNVEANSIDIIDVTNGNTYLSTGTANDGSEVVTLPLITLVAPGSHQFKIDGLNTKGNAFSRTKNYNWFDRRYDFIEASNIFGDSDVDISNYLNALAASNYKLKNGRTGTDSFSPSGEYIYFVWEDSLGGDENIFTLNGLPNDAWEFKTFAYTNPHGVTRNYRLFKTLSQLSAAFTVVVS